MVSTRRSVVKLEPVDNSVPDNIQSFTTPKPAPPAMDAVAFRNRDTDMANAHTPPSASPTLNVNGTATTMNGTNTQGSNGTATSSQTIDALQSLGCKSRQVIKAIQELEALKIKTTLPNLPKFVVVGDQSHGKSSIVEAVCDITLPRAAGTCTRCPFKITTTAGPGDWTCKISLQRHYTYYPKDGNHTASNGPFANFGWEEDQSLQPVDFQTVHDKSDLERLLRFAQKAILNPQIPPLNVFHATDPEDIADNVKFSPNVIALEISSPNLPELDFYDLPGTINVDSNRDRALVKFIEILVKSYVVQKESQILLAVSADQDIHNSLSFRFVDDCDAIDRCMGVLTKPDLVNEDSMEHICNVLEGTDDFILGNGWFVTKHLSQKDLRAGKGHAEARQVEEEFFSRAPWSTVAGAFAERFGTSNLRNALADKLREHFINHLPNIQFRIEGELTKVKTRLLGIPAPVTAPIQTVVTEITNLHAHIVTNLRAEGLENIFKCEYVDMIDKLFKKLQDAKPTIVFVTPGYKRPSIELDSDDEDDDMPRTPASKARKSNNGSAVRLASVRDESSRVRVSPAKHEADERQSSPDQKIIFRLSEIRDENKRSRVSSLGDSNWKLTEDRTTRGMSGWCRMVNESLDAIHTLTVSSLIKWAGNVLHSRQETRFFREVKTTLEKLCAQLMKEQRDFINHHLNCEVHKPVTYLQEELERRRLALTAELRAERLQQRGREHFDTVDAKSNRDTKPEDRKKKLDDGKWVKENLGPDPWEREILALGKPFAYYDMAAGGVVDVVYKHIDHGVMFGLEGQIKDKLLQELKVESHEHCAQLLAEDPQREIKRQQLEAQKTKLMKASEKLKGLAVLD